MTHQDFSLTLRIRHPQIDPSSISRELGIEPQHCWRAGEPRRGETGETGGTYRETYWVGLLPLSLLGPRLDRAGSHATKAAEPAALLYIMLMKMKLAAGFWRTFAEQGGTIDCILQVHQGERFHFEMSHALFMLLAELRVTLSMEVDTAAAHPAAA
jgi:hypothetical protein